MRRHSPFFKTFTPAAAGGESYVDLAEQKGTYFNIALEIMKDGVLCDAATMPTVVDYFELLINNTVQRKLTPAKLLSINAIKNKTFLNGYLDIFFSEADRSTGDGEDKSVWSMDGVSSFEIKVKWLPGVWVPSIRGFRLWHPTTIPANAVLPVTYYHTQFNELAGDRFLEIDNDGRPINHIHMFTDKITDYTYRRNDVPIIGGPKALIDHQYNDKKYTPDATICTVSQLMFTSREPDKIPALVAVNGGKSRAVHVIEATLSADAQFDVVVEAAGRWR